MTDYFKPGTLIDAIDAMEAIEKPDDDAHPPRAVTIAGGTDLVVQWKRRGAALPDLVVDLKGIDGMTGIAAEEGTVRIGPCTTLAEIARAPLLRERCSLLSEAASLVACPQVRNRATIGGNLCNASPAADMAVSLIVLDGSLEIASRDAEGEIKTRSAPVHAFFTGPGETVLREGELLSAVRVPFVRGTGIRDADDGTGDERAPRAYRAFEKFGTRPAMEIAVVSVGVALDIEWGKIVRARTAFGSVAPVPHRGRKTELCLEGSPLDDATIEKACATAMSEVSPISDVRASAEYRRQLLGILLRRMIHNARQD